MVVPLTFLHLHMQDLAERPFTMHIAGGGTLYTAHCPELDITIGGETSEEAVKSLYVLARAEIKGILQGKGGPGDERKKIAELVVYRLDNIESLFRAIKGPAPLQRNGLK
ncbi:MAG: hypothetical protein COX36_03050 [Candidatus Nealsonbacteria bacterium CG23_combo_of_CG06-09_8_20_14_all_38_19]|nr:MAG: hypothetical protein COX36_03050 [Candidatus Nealsonbacteria bacterium CG23_combo_of_CG06-09_8_20_14_all_38_19]